jgi:hypothetical protein
VGFARGLEEGRQTVEQLATISNLVLDANRQANEFMRRMKIEWPAAVEAMDRLAGQVGAMRVLPTPDALPSVICGEFCCAVGWGVGPYGRVPLKPLAVAFAQPRRGRRSDFAPQRAGTVAP